jgi:hypothetical protein
MPCPPSSAGSDAISARRSLLRPSTIATRDGWRKPRRCWRRPPTCGRRRSKGPGFAPRRGGQPLAAAGRPCLPGPDPHHALAMPWPRPGAPTRHTARQQARALQQHDPGARHVGHELGVATGKVPARCRSRAWTHPWGRQGSGWQRRRHGGRQRHHGLGRSGLRGGLDSWRRSTTEHGDVTCGCANAYRHADQRSPGGSRPSRAKVCGETTGRRQPVRGTGSRGCWSPAFEDRRYRVADSGRRAMEAEGARGDVWSVRPGAEAARRAR